MGKYNKQFLELFYNPGEHICVSHNGYGYHSISQEEFIGGLFTQKSPNLDIKPEDVTDSSVVLASINPIKGFRRDENVTAYRSFMVEMDDGTLAEQKQYIEELGLPYSICVFSGNKSLHFGIVLDEDLPNYEIWRDIAEWILNIASKADPMTKNPTRSIRFPGNVRKDGKGMEQRLVEINGRISHNKLAKFLNKYPELNPAEIRRKEIPKRPPETVGGIPLWVYDKLENGVDESKGRNNEWFGIAMELSKAGHSPDEMIAFCEPYFSPERDFTQREWEDIFKHAHSRAMRI